MRNSIIALSALFVFSAALGCGSDSGSADTATEGTTDEGTTEGTTDEGTTEGTTDEGTTDEGTTTGAEPVSFATVFKEVLQPKGCTAGYCHAGHAGGLLMDDMESAYKNLVNIKNETATPCDATIRVVPGEPDKSMLWVRVRPQEDDCLEADLKMPPFGQDALTDEQTQLIYNWILTGANP